MSAKPICFYLPQTGDYSPVEQFTFFDPVSTTWTGTTVGLTDSQYQLTWTVGLRGTGALRSIVTKLAGSTPAYFAEQTGTGTNWAFSRMLGTTGTNLPDYGDYATHIRYSNGTPYALQVPNTYAHPARRLLYAGSSAGTTSWNIQELPTTKTLGDSYYYVKQPTHILSCDPRIDAVSYWHVTSPQGPYGELWIGDTQEDIPAPAFRGYCNAVRCSDGRILALQANMSPPYYHNSVSTVYLNERSVGGSWTSYTIRVTTGTANAMVLPIYYHDLLRLDPSGLPTVTFIQNFNLYWAQCTNPTSFRDGTSGWSVEMVGTNVWNSTARPFVMTVPLWSDGTPFIAVQEEHSTDGWVTVDSLRNRVFQKKGTAWLNYPSEANSPFCKDAFVSSGFGFGDCDYAYDDVTGVGIKASLSSDGLVTQRSLDGGRSFEQYKTISTLTGTLAPCVYLSQDRRSRHWAVCYNEGTSVARIRTQSDFTETESDIPFTGMKNVRVAKDDNTGIVFVVGYNIADEKVQCCYSVDGCQTFTSWVDVADVSEQVFGLTGDSSLWTVHVMDDAGNELPYISRDNGQTWTVLGSSSPADTMKNLRVGRDMETGVLILAAYNQTDGKIQSCYSADGGATFSGWIDVATVNDQIFGLAGDSVAWTVHTHDSDGNQVVYLSQDNGRTWASA